MRVAGREAVSMVDLHHQAVTAVAFGLHDLAGASRENRIAGLAAKVDSRVHCRLPQERIEAHPEGTGDIRCAGGRAPNWNCGDFPFQRLERDRSRTDASELAREWIVRWTRPREKRSAHSRLCGLLARKLSAA